MSGEASSSGPPLQELVDDVVDYIWENERGELSQWDHNNHVLDLMRFGNQSFRENRFEEAINYYSRAKNIKPDDPLILGN